MSSTEETAALPSWAEMTDLDKGAALLHLHKRQREGAEYAVENYPARYFDHPALTALDRRRACGHAAAQWRHAEDLSPEDHNRMYDAALDADHARWHAENAEPPTHDNEGITGMQWDNLGHGGAA